MNQFIWAAIREYVAAEINLSLARHCGFQHGERSIHADICKLEEQSSRMETEVRRLIEALPAPQPALSPEQLIAIDMQVPLGGSY